MEIWPKNHAEHVAALNVDDGDIFLPDSFIQEMVLPGIAAAFIMLTITYLFAYYFLADWYLLLGHKDRNERIDPQKKRKISYQITNCWTNLLLSIAGLYCEFYLQTDDENPSLIETVRGNEHLVHFSSFQLGYQLWAIPMGLFYVNENIPMLVHHILVIVVASMSAFHINGFRYWTPFFYGVIELSSVPLAILNSFKDNPRLRETFPTQYSNCRFIFATLFLYIRIGMFVPRQYYFLRDHILLWTSSSCTWYRYFSAIVSISSFALLCLQFFWASLIIKGIITYRNKTKSLLQQRKES